MASIIFPLAQGVSYGAGITDVKRMEDSVRVGRNALLTAVAQSTEVYVATSLIGEALKVASLPEVPLAARIVCFITPPVLAFFIKQGINSPSVRNTALFIQNNIGLLCQLAATVSAVALIAFGHLALGIGSLTFIGIGFLDRSGLLPESIRLPLHEYSPIVGIAASLVVGDLLQKFFALISLVAFIYQKCFDPNEVVELNEVQLNSAEKQSLDLPLLKKILDGEVELEINSYHLTLDTLAPPPNVTIQDLAPLFDNINWPIHTPMVKAKFANDPRFKEQHGNIESIDEHELIAIAREDLQTFLQEVTERRIPNGEIGDYDRLESYLKSITHQLPNEDEPTRADAFIRLAIEGGGYCGPAKFHVAEELYSELALKNNAVPTDIKILLRLQDARTHWFKEKYGELSGHLKEEETCVTTCMNWVFDFQDLHAYNIFLNLHGRSMGLHKSSSDNDYVSAVDPITKLAVKKSTDYIQNSFRELYTANFAIDQLQNGLGHASIPRDAIYIWWSEWIQRQPIDEETKIELTEELQTNKLYDHPLQHGNELAPGPFKANFLKAMALDLGILKVAIQ